MSDNNTSFSFSFTEDGNTISCSFEKANDIVMWPEVAEKFFKFLSTAYGYEITAKDMIDEDFGNSRLSGQGRCSS